VLVRRLHKCWFNQHRLVDVGDDDQWSYANLLCILGIQAACLTVQSPSPRLSGTRAPIDSCNHNCPTPLAIPSQPQKGGGHDHELRLVCHDDDGATLQTQ
jgi:hypothetical protein